MGLVKFMCIIFNELSFKNVPTKKFKSFFTNPHVNPNSKDFFSAIDYRNVLYPIKFHCMKKTKYCVLLRK